VGGTGAGLQKVVEYADGQGLTEFWVWERDFVWQGAKRVDRAETRGRNQASITVITPFLVP
jgi:hypothetical protein